MSAPYPSEQKPGVPPAYGQANYYAQPPPTTQPPMATPMYNVGAMYGSMPVQCTCPQCRQTIVTRVEKKNGLLPWLICGGIALFGGIFGCCLIPFCIDSVKDTEHYCPSCGTFLGGKKQL